ncbi:MAG TPA: hypothetical protein VK516_07745 [Gemmatimonadaceae bacterium]|nr:hypothetical protein [Gemmatimonadaceae bacterium]
MRSSRRHRLIALIGTALALSACADQPTAPTLPPSLDLSASVTEGRKPTDDLSRGIAIALGDPTLRSELRDAMRASTLTNHKLILQEYLVTNAGTRLREGIATALKASSKDVDGLISAFPVMEMYLPFKEHRLSWRGGSELLIGATMDRSHTPVLHSFTTDGKQVALVRKDGTPKEPLLILNPSRWRNTRYQPQPNVPGPTVQDPGDGEESGSVTYVNKQDGTSTTLQLADILSKKANVPRASYMIACDESCGGGGSYGGGSVTPVDTTYVRAFEIYWIWDSEWGNHEVYFVGTFLRNNSVIMEAQYQRDGIRACSFAYEQGYCVAYQTWVPGVPLFIGPRLKGGLFSEYIHLRIYEDNWIVPDFHGTTDYYPNQWGQWHPMCVPFCNIETIFNPHAVVKLEWTMHT